MGNAKKQRALNYQDMIKRRALLKVAKEELAVIKFKRLIKSGLIVPDYRPIELKGLVNVEHN